MVAIRELHHYNGLFTIYQFYLAIGNAFIICKQKEVMLFCYFQIVWYQNSIPSLIEALFPLTNKLYCFLCFQGGLFVFLEHVAADRNTWTWTLQTIADPFHQILGDGCNTRRDTSQFLKQAGFSDLTIEPFMGRGMPLWVKPCIMGTACK